MCFRPALGIKDNAHTEGNSAPMLMLSCRLRTCFSSLNVGTMHTQKATAPPCLCCPAGNDRPLQQSQRRIRDNAQIDGNSASVFVLSCRELQATSAVLTQYENASTHLTSLCTCLDAYNKCSAALSSATTLPVSAAVSAAQSSPTTLLCQQLYQQPCQQQHRSVSSHAISILDRGGVGKPESCQHWRLSS